MLVKLKNIFRGCCCYCLCCFFLLLITLLFQRKCERKRKKKTKNIQRYFSELTLEWKNNMKNRHHNIHIPFGAFFLSVWNFIFLLFIFFASFLILILQKYEKKGFFWITCRYLYFLYGFKAKYSYDDPCGAL